MRFPLLTFPSRQMPSEPIRLCWKSSSPWTPAFVRSSRVRSDFAWFLIASQLSRCYRSRFPVQWSSREDFSIIIGERIITEWNTFQGSMGSHFHINELIQGRRYFFRACSGNVKGFGAYRISNPTSIIPSSWRDIEHKEHRFSGRQKVLDELFTAVRLCRPEGASEFPDSSSHRRNPKKKTTIKQLFSAASKFQRTLRRGIYLACILFCDDKVFVTNEDFIPVIEIDETYPSNLNNDYYWLMKVNISRYLHAFAFTA